MGDRSTTEVLRALDDLDVPDLRPTISARAAQTYVAVTPLPRRPRRLPLLAAAAALAVIAFVAGSLIGGDDPGQDVATEGDRDDRANGWAIAGEVELPFISLRQAPLVAAAGSSVWVSGDASDRVVLISGEGAPRIVHDIAVPGVVDLAATPSEAFALSRSGVVTRLLPDGSSSTLADLGVPDASDWSIAATGDAVWIAGARPDGLARIDSRSGIVTTVPVSPEPIDVLAGERLVWTVGVGSRTATPVDVATGAAGATVEPGAIGARATDGDTLWFVDETDESLRSVGSDGGEGTVIPLPDGTDGMAVTADLVWSRNGYVVQSYTRDGDLRSSLVPGAPSSSWQTWRGSVAGAPSALWVTVTDPGRVVLMRPGGER